MVYNISPNPLNPKSAYGLPPKPNTGLPAFGHQMTGTSAGYGSPVYPALPLNPTAQVFPVQRPMGYQQSVSVPLASLPSSSQVFIRSNPLVNATVPKTSPPPQGGSAVQNYYYNVSGKAEPSKKKDLKKFMFITAAVMTGMATTMVATIGALCFFMPGPARLFKKLGSRPFETALKGIKAFESEKGSLIEKISKTAKTLQDEITNAPVADELSPWQKVKMFFSKTYRAKQEQKIELAKQAASIVPKNSQSALDHFTNALQNTTDEGMTALADQFKRSLKAIGLDPESLNLAKVLADAFNHMDEKKISSVLKNMMGSGSNGQPIDYGQILADAFNQMDSEKLVAAQKNLFTTIIEGLEPEHIKKLMSAIFPQDMVNALNSKNTSEMASKLWEVLTTEQKDAFYNYLKNLGNEAMQDFSRSDAAYTFTKNNAPGPLRWFMSGKAPTVEPPKVSVETNATDAGKKAAERLNKDDANAVSAAVQGKMPGGFDWN